MRSFEITGGVLIFLEDLYFQFSQKSAIPLVTTWTIRRSFIIQLCQITVHGFFDEVSTQRTRYGASLDRMI